MSTTKREDEFMRAAIFVSIVFFATFMILNPQVYASSAAQVEIVNSFIKVIKMVARFVGVIFAIVGLVSLVTAHANEDGPAQQKAAQRIAVGLALVAIGPILDAINVSSLLSSN